MAVLERFLPGDIALLDPLLLQKREADRAYLLRLSTDNLLRPFRLEAGLWSEAAKPEGIHWGWESPTSQLRGHFLGHWLSAASLCAASTGDREIRGKAEAVIEGLAECQEANGGGWLGSIPEKYLERIAAGKWTWAPHYTVHKTFMGLLDAYSLIGSERALALAENWARWFLAWTAKFTRAEMDAVLDYETGGMLEIWAELLGATGRPEYRTLMERYERRRLFDPLLAGKDPLSNMHANTTIPEILGAARAFEVTGEERWLEIAKAYWALAAERLPRSATGGSGTGEVWVPEGRLPHRLGDKNQELCTVYNMMRLAEFLLRHTGEARFADYWERNLRNGIMAQGFWKGSLVNGEVATIPLSGLVSYFLPLRPGSMKYWASETDHFFCCHGTNVQANAAHTGCTFYRKGAGLLIANLVASYLSWERPEGKVEVEVARVDQTGSCQIPDGVAQAHPAAPDAEAFDVRVSAAAPSSFPVSIRLPWWLAGEARLSVNGERIRIDSRPSSFVEMTRAWRNDVIRVELPKRLVSERLSGSDNEYAFMDGPDLLAGLCDAERILYCDDPGVPERNLGIDDEREWSRWKGSYKTKGQNPGIRFIPLRDVGYERYAVYFSVAPRREKP